MTMRLRFKDEHDLRFAEMVSSDLNLHSYFVTVTFSDDELVRNGIVDRKMFFQTKSGKLKLKKCYGDKDLNLGGRRKRLQTVIERSVWRLLRSCDGCGVCIVGGWEIADTKERSDGSEHGDTPRPHCHCLLITSVELPEASPLLLQSSGVGLCDIQPFEPRLNGASYIATKHIIKYPTRVQRAGKKNLKNFDIFVSKAQQCLLIKELFHFISEAHKH